jgi:hypothetical protein
VSTQLEKLGIAFTYEQHVITYEEPATLHKYTPDFVLPNGIIVETKGRWLTADRKKHKLVKAQHPDLDIRFVFSRSRQTIGKKSTTTYADYCDKQGWQYADVSIPTAWLREKPTAKRLAAIQRFLKTKKP